MSSKKGQGTIEYIGALFMTVVFAAMILAQLDGPIRQWWDALARKVAAPCPTEKCLEQAPPTVEAN